MLSFTKPPRESRNSPDKEVGRRLRADGEVRWTLAMASRISSCVDEKSVGEEDMMIMKTEEEKDEGMLECKQNF